MAIEESQATGGPLPKAPRKSAADEPGEEIFFTKRPTRQQEASASPGPDPAAHRIEAPLAGLQIDGRFGPGRNGYTVCRARGKGAPGTVATANANP